MRIHNIDEARADANMDNDEILDGTKLEDLIRQSVLPETAYDYALTVDEIINRGYSFEELQSLFIQLDALLKTDIHEGKSKRPRRELSLIEHYNQLFCQSNSRLKSCKIEALEIEELCSFSYFLENPRLYEAKLFSIITNLKSAWSNMTKNNSIYYYIGDLLIQLYWMDRVLFRKTTPQNISTSTLSNLGGSWPIKEG